MSNGHGTLILSISLIGELPPEIYVGLIDETAVECLKARLSVEPLLTPIWVRKNGNASKGAPYSVIAGRHRLRAAIALGWSEIAAEVRAGPHSKPDELRRLQVAENLDRRILRPIERALCIMNRWWQVADALADDPQRSQKSRNAKARWTASATMANADLIDDAVGSASGMSARSVQRYRRVHDKLVVPFPDHFALINAHPLAENLGAMTKLAGVKVFEDRRKAVELLLDPQRNWVSISEVLVATGVSESTGNRLAEGNHIGAAIKVWSVMADEDRRKHIEWLADNLTPGQAMAMVARFNLRKLL